LWSVNLSEIILTGVACSAALCDFKASYSRGNVGPMGHFDKFKHNTLKNNTFLRLLFPHFHIVKPTSWLDVSRVFRRRQQLQWRLNGKNLVLLIFSNEK